MAADTTTPETPMPAQPRRSLRLDQETWDQLDLIADKHGVPWTAVAKAAIARGLKGLPTKAIEAAAKTTGPGNPQTADPEFQRAASQRAIEARKKLSRNSEKEG